MSYDFANMFPQSGDGLNVATNTEFLKTFGNTLTKNHTIEPKQTERRSNLHALNTDESSFFDFEPASSTDTPYQNLFSTPGAPGMPWSNNVNFRPLSPPDSASFSPKSWPYHDYQSSTPSNIPKNAHPGTTRAHYGQVTPPDDENDSESLLDYHLREQLRQHEVQQPSSLSPTKKRKRNNTINTESNDQQSTTKRVRKYTSRGSTNVADPNKPEDVKRSKFLERNRVAASKCRQKKKEWIQGLENRARELQKNNSQLRVMVESLRQEVLYLKSDMLKHNTCDCHQIQEFMNSGVDHSADAQQDEDPMFRREQSPIESMPVSRMGTISPLAWHGRGDSESTSPAAEHSNSSTFHDDNALEELLTNSINGEMSHEDMPSQVAVVT